MKKTLLLTLVLVIVTALGFAQDAVWTVHNANSGKITTDKAVARQAFPKEFKLFDLTINPLKQNLFSITNKNATKHSTIISLPNADGNIEQFEVYEASNFVPALQANFPEIRAFSGKGITDKYATLKLSISPQGIQTMVFRTDKENEFIEAYSQDHTVYAVFKSQRSKGQLGWTCSTEEQNLMSDINSKVNGSNTSNSTASSTGELKTMLLAQSCNGEYSNYFGAFSSAQVGLVLAAFNATLTRANGVYEKDLALHLNLIANTADVIYYDPATDPYTTLGAWNGQLQSTLNAVIGAANYDIGHMFGASGGGGNAGCIGCVCGTLKGSGITSPADGIPQGDNFDIDYVVHEVGHQLGGNHTFSHNTENSGNNKEVGSGITIMGYAGITPAQDVVDHSIDIFHQTSIAQIQANLATKTCPITTVITPNNATPVIAPIANFTIPISTPFALTGSATDANAGDALTYCWEQNNQRGASETGAASAASPTKITGPNWLTFPATANATRTFPRLATILAGNFVTGPLPGGTPGFNIEALSSIGRTLNFRLTVRDNSPYVSTGLIKVGQTAFTDMTVTVDATSGPFRVTVPNTNVTWAGGSSQTITWDVNNTTLPPVSCANVKISYSNDGGITFPTVLAASTANDGTEVLTIPAGATTTARIKVESIGNIFFDISNTNFTVTVPPNDFVFGASTPSTSSCPAPTNPTVTIPTTVTGTFTTPITLAATAGVPAGTTVTFAPNPLTPGSSTVATLNNANILANGTYIITITGTAGASVKTTTITYIITAGAGPVLTAVANQTVCAPATATFTVSTVSTPVTYQWQSAPTIGGTYTNITGATSASYTTGVTSAGMNGMGFRVLVSTQCGTTTSNNALLTVNTSAAITTQPVNQPSCTGNTATFTGAASGLGVTYQWQSSTTGIAGSFTNIPGATSASYTTPVITATTPAYYQLVATTTTCPGTATSNVAQLTINVTAAIGTQPTAQTVCAPGTATFTVAATGSGLSYQWQVATAAAPTVFTNVGTNANSFTTGATSAAMNGNIYRVVVTGSCNAVTSSTATLTVNNVASVTTQPTAQIVCNGTTATFTVVGAGSGTLSYQWQSGPSATGPFTNVTTGTGATTASYTTAATIPGMNGSYYQVVVNGSTCPGAVTSTPVLLTVNTVAIIATQPTAQTVCKTQTATFTVAAVIVPGLTYQWQSAPSATGTFTNIPGATSPTYTTPATVLADNGKFYRVNITGTCSATPTTSNAVGLTVNDPISITAGPQVQSGCAGDNFTFSVTANGGTFYQWQSSPTGLPGTFTNIAGANGPSLTSYTITGAPLFLNGTYFRVFGTVLCGAGISSDTSTSARIFLSNRPSVVLTAPVTSTNNPAVNSMIFATVSPANANVTYTWKRNGVIIPNTLGATSITLNVDDAASYQVTITDNTTQCQSVSNVVTTSAATSDNLLKDQIFTYPNPVRTIMQIRFNNSTATDRATMVNIYDEKGAKVFAKSYTINNTFGRMEVDMSRMQNGLYMIYLMDKNGKRLAGSKVVKFN